MIPVKSVVNIQGRILFKRALWNPCAERIVVVTFANKSEAWSIKACIISYGPITILTIGNVPGMFINVFVKFPLNSKFFITF